LLEGDVHQKKEKTSKGQGTKKKKGGPIKGYRGVEKSVFHSQKRELTGLCGLEEKGKDTWGVMRQKERTGPTVGEIRCVHRTYRRSSLPGGRKKIKKDEKNASCSKTENQQGEVLFFPKKNEVPDRQRRGPRGGGLFYCTRGQTRVWWGGPRDKKEKKKRGVGNHTTWNSRKQNRTSCRGGWEPLLAHKASRKEKK